MKSLFGQAISVVSPVGVGVDATPIDNREASRIVVETMLRLRDGHCVLCEQLCRGNDRLRSYVLGRLLSHHTIRLEDIGDGRLCLLYHRPEWQHLTPETMRRLRVGDWLFAPDQSIWEVTCEPEECVIHAGGCVKIATIRDGHPAVEVYCDWWTERDGNENAETCLRASECNGWLFQSADVDG